MLQNGHSFEITIRRANESDAGELSQMISDNAKITLAPYYSEKQWNVFIKYYSAEALERKIRQQLFFCGESDGVIVGSVALDNNFVAGLYTHVNYLNRGIGTKMMKHLEAAALERSLDEIRLAASPAGLNFYLKNGWRIVEDIVIDHYGVGFEETLMAKELRQR